MHIIVAGGRSFADYPMLRDKLDLFVSETTEPITVVSGTARGADTLGEQWAKERGHAIERYPANWDTHGRKAGWLRNNQMADVADAVVVFWNGRKQGSGSWMMIQIAIERDLPLRVVRYSG